MTTSENTTRDLALQKNEFLDGKPAFYPPRTRTHPKTMKQAVKCLLVAGAIRGFIPYRVAELLIQRGGLKHE